MKLENKVAIVTGASKGIGKAIAQRYSSEGASVVICGRTYEDLEALANNINSLGGKALPVKADVSKQEEVENLVKKTATEFGRLDIMVNNAGVTVVGPSHEMSASAWENTLKTDLFGVFYGCQSAARQMMENSAGGVIINVTSMYGLVAAPKRAAYCCSKAAANMLTKVLACEWSGNNIRVNAIAPGYVRTELVQRVIDNGDLDLEAIFKRTPQGRIGEVKDIEGLAVFLASPESSYINGSVIPIDGGWTAYGYI